MRDPNSFEKKVRDKLKGYQEAFEPADWKAFRQTYGYPGGTDKRRKTLPYLWSFLLFAITWILLYKHPVINKTPNTPAITVIRDTIVQWKTDTVFVASSPNQIALPGNKVTAVAKSAVPAKTEAAEELDANISMSKSGSNLGIPSNASFLLESENKPGNTHSFAYIPLQNKNYPTLKPAGYYLLAKPLPALASRNLANPTVPVETSKSRNKPNLNLQVGAAFSLLFPGENNDNDRLNLFSGLSFEFSAGKLSLTSGVQRGERSLKIDDIEEMSSERLNQFPSFAELPRIPEDVKISTQEWISPILLSYPLFSIGKWKLQPAAGIVFSHTIKEAWTYEFDDDYKLPDIRILTNSEKQWQLSYALIESGLIYKAGSRFQIGIYPQLYIPTTNKTLNSNLLAFQLKLSRTLF